MHEAFHKYFKSSNFKYEDNHPRPDGRMWVLLEKMVKDALSAADFAVIWKAFIHIPSLLNTCMRTSNISSALDGTGVVTKVGIKRVQAGITSDPSCPNKIMSFCPHYCNLPTEVARNLLETIPIAVPFQIAQGYLYENDYPVIWKDLPPEVDNCPKNLTGKKLNDMVTNRQRVVIFNDSFLATAKKNFENKLALDLTKKEKIMEQQRRKKVMLANAERKDNATTCSNPTCLLLKMDQSPKDQSLWVSCESKKCKIVFCHLEACQIMGSKHQLVCTK